MFESGARSMSAWMLLPVARSSMKKMYEPGKIHPVVHVSPRLAKNEPKAPTLGLPSPSSSNRLTCNRPSPTGVFDEILPVSWKPPLDAEARARLPTFVPDAASTASPPAGDVNGSQLPARGIG